MVGSVDRAELTYSGTDWWEKPLCKLRLPEGSSDAVVSSHPADTYCLYGACVQMAANGPCVHESKYRPPSESYVVGPYV